MLEKAFASPLKDISISHDVPHGERNADVLFFDRINITPSYRSAFNKLSKNFNLSFQDLGSPKNATYADALVKNLEVHKYTSLEVTDNSSALYTGEKVLICSPKPSFIPNHSGNDITIAGTQRHLSFDFLNEYKSISLGKLSEDLSLLEPIIRNSKVFIFDLNSIKASELMMPGQNPCGLNIMDACKLARYAGFSDSLKHFQIIIPSQNNQIHHDTVALMIWYFLEGRDHYIKNDSNPTRCTSYILSHSDLELEFIKDELSSKWWIKDPNGTERLIPCSESDYERIKAGENPLYLIDLLEMV